MKTKLTFLGLGLFVISFVLPAYDHLNGFQCAELCAVEIYANDLGDPVYYFPFTFSNVAMVVIPILLLTKFRNKPVPKSVIVIQIVLLLHVLSWLFVGGINDILIGYYVWMLSMVLILWASLLSRRAA